MTDAEQSRSGLNSFQALISQLLKLCVWLWWTITSWYLSPQFKYMIFHIFICILHHLRVYYELTMCPAPSWLDSSVGGAFALRTLSTSFKKSVFMELGNSAEFSMYLFSYRCNPTDKGTSHKQCVATLIALSFLVRAVRNPSILTKGEITSVRIREDLVS